MGGAVAWIGAGLEHRFGPLVALPIAIAAGCLIYCGLAATIARDAALRMIGQWLPNWASAFAPAPAPALVRSTDFDGPARGSGLIADLMTSGMQTTATSHCGSGLGKVRNSSFKVLSRR